MLHKKELQFSLDIYDDTMVKLKKRKNNIDLVLNGLW